MHYFSIFLVALGFLAIFSSAQPVFDHNIWGAIQIKSNDNLSDVVQSKSDKGVQGLIQNHCPFKVHIRMAVAEHPSPREWETCEQFAYGETQEMSVEPGYMWITSFPAIKDSCGISIKVSKYPNASRPNLYQFEYAWSREDGKVWYNLSGVDGTPFEDVARSITSLGNDASCPVLRCDAGVVGVAKCEHCEDCAHPILGSCSENGKGMIVGRLC